MTSSLLAVLCGVTMAAPPAGLNRLTLDDLLSVEGVGETALSPDGKTFALIQGGQIALMPEGGGWPVALTTTPGSKSDINWSPDGRMLAYASLGSIWVVPSAGGPPRRLTSAAPGAGDPRLSADRAPRWSPKGKWILFVTGRRGHSSLMVVSDDGMVNNFLTSSEGDEDSAVWSRDGWRVSYTERAPEYFSGKLKALKFDAEKGSAAGEPVTLYASPTDRGGGWSIGEAAWAPDSKSLAVVLQDSGWDKVYRIEASGGAPKAVTHGEFVDASPVFSPDGKALAVVSSRKNLEESGVWIVPLDGSPARSLYDFPVPGRVSSPVWSPDGDKIYFHRSTPIESTDLLEAGVNNNSAPKYLTHTTPKNFDGATTMPEEVHYRSKDGMDIASLLYKPRGMKPGDRHAAVLWIHGGPEGQDVFRFDAWAQYLAQSGYLVLQPNYRGSNGYGEKFRNLNVEDSGGGEADDVAAGAQYLVAQGLADPKRLAIAGGSHGGTMVAYMVTKYPDLFQAAIELYGVVDRATFVERTNRNSAIRWMMKMGGTPQQKPDVYRKANILPDVSKIRTPLLIMHGENDPQVPSYESVQFVRELKKHGKVYFYYTYPGEGHGFTQHDHILDAWNKQLAFLEKYIQPKYGMSSTSVDDLPVSAAPPANH